MRELRVQRLGRNLLGRDLVVGDIHGCFSKLAVTLDRAGFDPSRDRLLSVGDLVDRGPESDLVLDWLDKPWFFPVCGNHDDFAIRWPTGTMDARNYLANGGAWNLSNPRDVQVELAEALAALPVALEVETAGGPVGVVHAEVPSAPWPDFVASLGCPDLSGGERRALLDCLLWSRHTAEGFIYGSRELELGEAPPMVEGLRALVVGHSPVLSPTVLGNVHYIDTRGWRNEGRFTLLDVATLRPLELPAC